MNFSNKYLQFIIGYIAFSFSILEGLSFLIDNYGISPKLLDYTLLTLVVGFFGTPVTSSDIELHISIIGSIFISPVV